MERVFTLFSFCFLCETNIHTKKGAIKAPFLCTTKIRIQTPLPHMALKYMYNYTQTYL